MIQRLPPEKDRRYHELAEKLDRGLLTAKERAELRALVEESERLTLENARALLRHRDPEAHAATLAAEQRVLRRERAQTPGQRRQRAE